MEIPFGKELILDLHNCNRTKFSRSNVEQYLTDLCDVIDMERASLHVWEYPGGTPQEGCLAHLAGISAVQFIKTSSITIHTVDELNKVYINIFSCKDFDPAKAETFTSKFFEGRTKSMLFLSRI